jgi:hypothetical protein
MGAVGDAAPGPAPELATPHSVFQPPSRLLPERRNDYLPTVSSLRAPAAAITAATPATQHTQTNEVHVHIGRIDITALQDAPAERKPRAPARQTRPLSDYLARRPTP